MFTLIELPNDVKEAGYKCVRPYHYEQVYRSESVKFTGTVREFLASGYAYEYVDIDKYTRKVISKED